MPIILDPADTSPASWLYANQDDVEDAIGTYNLKVQSNQEDDADQANVARIQKAGNWADAYMHKYLNGVYVTPLTNLSAEDRIILQEISVDLVIWKLSRWRTFQLPPVEDGDDRELKKAEDFFVTVKTKAEDQLSDLVAGIITLNSNVGRQSVVTAPATNADALDISGQRMYPKRVRPFGYPWTGTSNG